MRCFTIGFMLFAAFMPAVVSGQGTAAVPKIDSRIQEGSNISVQLRDGSTIYGRFERRGDDSVVVVGASGRTAFAITAVRELRDVGEVHEQADGTKEYWFPNANTTRLFFAPTGRTLAKGQGYFADHYVLVGSLSYGATDRVTIGGGGLMIPSSELWFVTPKIGLVQKDKLNVAVGALFGGVGGESTGGIAFAAATFGGTDNSATVAVGNAFSGSQASRKQILMIGGEARASRRLSFVTENYLFSGADPFISYGLRILGEKMSVDLAFWNSLGESMVFPGIPYVDFVIRF